MADLVTYLTGKKVTPKETATWMVKHGYAVPGHGTEWAGMPACAKNYGLTDKEYSTVVGSFEAFSKHKTGYILFRKGTKGGITWTKDGHYVAVEDYKVKNGKHFFYTCDSGNRGNDGWHCYEDTMYGLVAQIHVVYKKKAESTPKNPISLRGYKGFDISYVQNGLSLDDFKKAKVAGWDFVIIRIGTVLKGELYEDKEFKDKLKKAKKAGLTVGAYFYSMAKTEKDAKKEAEFCLKKVDELDYPIFIDFEDQTLANLGKDKSKSICEAFCATVEKAGLQAGVYASYNWLTNKIATIDKKYAVWLAQYPKATYKGRYELHQYTSTGNVAGIGKKVDCNTSTLEPKKCKKKQ